VSSRHDDVLLPVAQRCKATPWPGLCCGGGLGAMVEWRDVGSV
jgi:hypothetical protein